ncbi:helix-turn-helix domain-containing protein [Ekhidna sp.]
MKVVEIEPKNEVLKNYVSKYQYFDVDGPLLVKAIPTGTLECFVIIGGSFEIFDPEKATFFASEHIGVFPMGSQVSAYFIPKNVKCFNIKLKAQSLSLPKFKGVISDWKSFSVESFLGAAGMEKIRTFDYSDEENFADTIDEILLENNDFNAVDTRLEAVLNSMVAESTSNMKVDQIAENNHMTIKSLERLTKKVFGMPPKKLMGILRFGESAKYLKNTEGYKFIDALQFGYYDQSHFIRECKKITKMSPKEFLSKLNLDTNDLVLDGGLDEN